jgi:hypothetical protein
MNNIFRSLSLILVLLTLTLASVGCGETTDEPDVWPMSFSGEGITITLTNEFFELDPENSTTKYSSKAVTVTTQKTPFTTVGTSVLTPASYALEVLGTHGIVADVAEIADYACFSFAEMVGDKEYYYKAYCYKSSDAYWVVQFSCPMAERNAYDAQFDEWASTVSLGQ